jgi:hypothetical protein
VNLARAYNDVAASQGSPGRWEDLTPLQREAVERLLAAIEGGEHDPQVIAQAAIRHLVDQYGLDYDEGAAESYTALAAGLLRARWDLPSSPWADALPTTFPDEPQPGAWLLPEDEYHADPLRRVGWSANASTLKGMTEPGGSPAMAKYEREHPPQKDAWDIGTVTHCLTLGTGPEIVEVRYKSWQYKEAKGEREAARERGAVALLTKDLQACEEMAAAVRSHPLAGGLLRVPGASEVTLVWRERIPGTDREVWGRCMVDRHPDPAVVAIAGDLKSADGPLTKAWLEKRSWDLGYWKAAEWYGRGFRAVHGVELEAFWLLFVRSKPPHLVHVVELDQDLLARGREANDLALQAWDRCQRTGDWPGPGQDDEPTLIGAPRWAR